MCLIYFNIYIMKIKIYIQMQNKLFNAYLDIHW